MLQSSFKEEAMSHSCNEEKMLESGGHTSIKQKDQIKEEPLEKCFVKEEDFHFNDNYNSYGNLKGLHHVKKEPFEICNKNIKQEIEEVYVKEETLDFDGHDFSDTEELFEQEGVNSSKQESKKEHAGMQNIGIEFNETSKKKTLRQYIRKRSPSEKCLQCDECSYSTEIKRRLINHVRRHTGEKPFKCDHCSYRTSTKQYLVRHIGSKHNDEKPFKCDECSFSTIHKYYLTSHLRRHTGEKPFKCQECFYSTLDKQRLRLHMRMHTGEKPFKCEECSYATSAKEYLRKHIASKHTDEKPFKCDQCSYSTIYKFALIGHIRAHTGEKPFKCKECPYSATVKLSLVRHSRIHTGEKPHKCDKCSFSAAVRHSLLRHIASKHNGEKHN